MAIPSVNTTSDTFDLWRIKTNLIATLEGDLTLLATTVKTDLVSAINETVTDTRALLIRAIAMA